MIDLSAQRQYIQRAVNVKYSFIDTNQQTLYTAPNGGDDYTFAVLMGIFACDHGNQQTNLDISVVDTSANEFFLLMIKNTYFQNQEMFHYLARVVFMISKMLQCT